MTIHETIKKQIIDAMRAKDAIRLEVLRGLSALFSNELIARSMKGASAGTTGTGEFLDDEGTLALIKRSVKQRRDSIEQFEKGGRKDLADKERTELAILETYLPATMSRDEIRKIAETKVKPDKASAGKFTGELMRELKGKADGADVKAVVDEMLK